MKIKNQKSELEYKNYKNLFGKIKKRSKKLHYSKLIIEYSKNVKKPWSVIKEAIGKEKKLAAIISKKSLCRKTGNHRYKIYSRKLQQLFC